MGTTWQARLRANWYAAIPAAVWLVFVGYAALWRFTEARYWIDVGLGLQFYTSIPVLCGGAALLFGVALVVAAALRKIPRVKGLLYGTACCLAGAGFWYLVFLSILYA